MISKILKFDWILLSAVGLLLGISLAVLYSISTSEGAISSGSVFVKQCGYVVIGLGVMVFLSLANYHYFRSYANYLYFGSLFLLILVLIIGKTIRGTVGWIGIGGFHIQPVEIVKLSLIVFLASFISQKKMELSETGRIFISLILIGIMIFLVIKQPDFGSAMVLAGTWIGMTLVSGVTRKTLGMILIFAIFSSGLIWMSLAAYQKDRIVNLIKPNSDLQGVGYNVNQSIIAVGSGGLIGKGIGHGSQSQLNFLPEKHTDFIFASIAEELGLLGSCFVIGLFLIIFYRIKEIANSANDNFGYLVAVGILLVFFIQFVENVGMNIGIMPVTGIPLPFLSYGGSSLIVSLALVGILSNIHSSRESVVRSED
jgi:rod shape determining protein RodA